MAVFVFHGVATRPVGWPERVFGGFSLLNNLIMNPVTLHLWHWYGLLVFTLLLGLLAVFPRLTLWLWGFLGPFPDPLFQPKSPMTEEYRLRHGPLSGQMLSAVTDQDALVLYRAQCPAISQLEYNLVGQRIRELHHAGAQQMLRNTSAEPFRPLQHGPFKDDVY